VFVYQGTPEQGEDWFGDLRADGSEAALADLGKQLYDRFGVDRGGLAAMFGPGAMACGIRAVRKGHRVGRKIGDAWTLPYVAVITAGSIVWEHRGSHAGDDPEPELILAAARSAATTGRTAT
jgi:hypothetical protein